MREKLSTTIEVSSDSLNVPLGYNMDSYQQEPIIMDMSFVTPHAYIVGQTGSGKSSVTKFMIKQLIENYAPEQLEIWYLDNQGLEVDEVEDLKHVKRAADNVECAYNELRDLINIMELRIKLLKKFKCKNILKFNSIVGEDEKLPFIVCFIDEMRPVMINKQLKKNYCNSLSLLVQTSRKVGIHLIFSTQRAVDGHLDTELRSAISGKIGLRVSSKTESEYVVGVPGCEKIRADKPGFGYVALGEEITKFYTPYVSEESFEALIEKYGKE